MAYKMKMYDPSGELVEVNRNQLNELLGQGYSFMRPKTTTTTPKTTTTTPNTTTTTVATTTTPVSTSSRPYNPYYYLPNEKDIQTAYIDPKTGNMSIVGGGGGDKTPYQMMSADEFISKGYVPITDPNIISQLQQGALNTSTFTNTQQWQDWFDQVAGLVTPLSQAEIDAAKQRLADYNAYIAYARPSEAIPLSKSLVEVDNTPTSSTGGSSGISGGSGINNMIQELADAQKRQRIAALDKAKSNALSALADEEAALKPYYYDLRNRTAAQSDISAKNFAEYMAAQGIRGSAAGLPEIYRNAALQGQLGTLNRQEAADIADIARRRSGIESAYEYDVAAAMADIDAQALQNYIDNMRIMQAQRVADLAAQGKTSTGELTLQGRQALQELTLRDREAQHNELARQAALLAAQHYDDIQAYINTLDPNDPLVPYLYAERRKKIQAQAEQRAAAVAAASEAEQQRWKNAFETFKATGRITSPEQARILGLPMGATVADVDIARMNAQTSRMNAQTSAYNAQQRAQQQAANLDYKKQQDLLAQSSQRVKQYAAQIDNLYITNQYDDEGRVIGKTFDPDVVKAYIKNLNTTGQITDDEARQLLGMYGFTF